MAAASMALRIDKYKNFPVSELRRLTRKREPSPGGLEPLRGFEGILHVSAMSPDMLRRELEALADQRQELQELQAQISLLIIAAGRPARLLIHSFEHHRSHHVSLPTLCVLALVYPLQASGLHVSGVGKNQGVKATLHFGEVAHG